MLAIEDASLLLRGEVYSASDPLQASGQVGAFPFYFRAKGDFWEFSLAMSPGSGFADAVEVENESQGFFRSGDRPGAGEMPPAEAADLIKKCAREFLDRNTSRTV